jgi:predicted O-methyltransferase YrrM
MPITREILNKYRKDTKIFIESGTALGHTTMLAVKNGFDKIYTIELSEKYYELAKIKFEKYPQVVCLLGNSKDKISEILNEIKEPALFWLDAHFCGGDSAKADKLVPLYEELETISKHYIKDHTIMIDDVRLMGDVNEPMNGWKGISKLETEEKCRLINNSYSIYYESDILSSDDILIATV